MDLGLLLYLWKAQRRWPPWSLFLREATTKRNQKMAFGCFVGGASRLIIGRVPSSSLSQFTKILNIIHARTFTSVRTCQLWEKHVHLFLFLNRYLLMKTTHMFPMVRILLIMALRVLLTLWDIPVNLNFNLNLKLFLSLKLFLNLNLNLNLNLFWMSDEHIYYC